MKIRQRLQKLNANSFIELYNFLKDFHDYLSNMDANKGIEEFIDEKIKEFKHWSSDDYVKLDNICARFSEHFTHGVFSYSMCTLASFAEHGRTYSNKNQTHTNENTTDTGKATTKYAHQKTRDSVLILQNCNNRKKRKIIDPNKRKVINIDHDQHLSIFKDEEKKLSSFREKIIEAGNFAINLSNKSDNLEKNSALLALLTAYDLSFLVDDYLRKLFENKSEENFITIKSEFTLDIKNCIQTAEDRLNQMAVISSVSNNSSNTSDIGQFFCNLFSFESKPNNKNASIIEIIKNLKNTFLATEDDKEIKEEKNPQYR